MEIKKRKCEKQKAEQANTKKENLKKGKGQQKGKQTQEEH